MIIFVRMIIYLLFVEEELIRDITDKYEMQERLKLLELNQSLMDNLHISSSILRQSKVWFLKENNV